MSASGTLRRDDYDSYGPGADVTASSIANGVMTAPMQKRIIVHTQTLTYVATSTPVNLVVLNGGRARPGQQADSGREE